MSFQNLRFPIGDEPAEVFTDKRTVNSYCREMLKEWKRHGVITKIDTSPDIITVSVAASLFENDQDRSNVFGDIAQAVYFLHHRKGVHVEQVAFLPDNRSGSLEGPVTDTKMVHFPAPAVDMIEAGECKIVFDDRNKFKLRKK